MRTSDLFHLAWRTLRGRWAVLPAAGFAIAAFCLCFSGAILASVQEEKSQPYEIVVSAQGDKALTDSDVAQISQIGDVTAATAVLEAPAAVQTGDYAAELNLTGMDSGYIEGAYDEGGAYPADSVMPYIVLNEAACKAFSSKTGDAGMASDAPGIDWLSASFSVQMGDGTKPVVAKVCGILAGNEDLDDEAAEPAAYISLVSAKTLLKQSGASASYGSMRVRVTNIGAAQAVSRAISALGLSVGNSTDELQAGWDMQMKEMTYLLVLGGFCLLCAATVLAAGRAVTAQRQKRAFEGLRWAGLTGRDEARLHMLHALIASALGAAAGMLVSLALPSFLTAGLTDSSVFLLPVPLPSALASLALCLVAGAVPLRITGIPKQPIVS